MVISTNKMGRDSAAMQDRAVDAWMMYHLEPGQQWHPAHDTITVGTVCRPERAKRLRIAHVEDGQGVCYLLV